MAAGCSGAAGGDPGEATASTSSAIYGGAVDNDAQQNASVVALEIGSGQTFTLCSGELLAPNVVLTARHCVSVQTNPTISCDQNGNTLNGADFGDDQPLASIHVMVGPAIYQNETPAAGAKAIYHPTGTTLCNADVALVVLDTNITTIAPMRVRITTGITSGESVRTVGFGTNDQNQPIGTRFRKDAVSVLAVGSVVSASQTPLGGNEFELGESSCGGDSGGPAVDEKTGAIVGIASRAGADCTLAYGHVYTSLQGFAAIFQQAFAAAGGSWVDESAPQPTVDAGAPGSSFDGGGGSSSSGSSSGGPGPTHYGGVNLQAGKGATCSAGPAPSGSGTEAAFAGLVVFSLLLIRRPRQPAGSGRPRRRQVS
jgi:MYXO-CTERM domain-containing protein